MKRTIDAEAKDIRAVAKTYKISSQKLTRLYKEKLSDYLSYRKLNEKSFETRRFVFQKNISENLAIDETGLFNGELYTIVYNKQAKGKKGSLVALIKGTKASVITGELIDKISAIERMNVKEITLDMSNTMDWISRQSFPNARKTTDKFHVIKLVSEAVQQVRIGYRWLAIDEENKLKEQGKNKRPTIYENGDSKKQLLARSRWLLYKDKKQWSEQQRQRAEILFREFPKIKKAYRYYIEFRKIYKMNKLQAEFYLSNWIQKVKKSDIPVLKIAAKSIENHFGKIINFFCNKATNAAIENFNRKLKSFIEKLRGVNDKDFFFYRIFQLFA